MAEGDMIQRNIGSQTTDAITHPTQQVTVLHIQCIDPEEHIPLSGPGVEALNKDTLPLPRYPCLEAQHPLHIPIQWGRGQSPTSTQGGPPIVRSKTRDLPSIFVADTPQ